MSPTATEVHVPFLTRQQEEVALKFGASCGGFFVFFLFPLNFVLLFRDFFGWPSGVGSPWAGWLLSGLGGSRAALAGPGAALCDMREVLGCFPGGRALG